MRDDGTTEGTCEEGRVSCCSGMSFTISGVVVSVDLTGSVTVVAWAGCCLGLTEPCLCLRKFC